MLKSTPAVSVNSDSYSCLILAPGDLLVPDLVASLRPRGITPLVYYFRPEKDSGFTANLPNQYLDSLSQLPQNAFDYVICLFPSAGKDFFKQIDVLLNLSHPYSKIVFLDYFTQQNYLDESVRPVIRERDFRFNLVTQIYGSFTPPNTSNPALSILTQALSGQLNLPTHSQVPIYPTFSSDVSDGLLKTLFHHHTRTGTYLLTTLEPTPLIDFAYNLKELLTGQSPIPVDFSAPDLDIPDFDRDAAAAAQAQLSWHPDTDLRTGLLQLLSTSIQTRSEDANSLEASSPQNQASQAGYTHESENQPSPTSWSGHDSYSPPSSLNPSMSVVTPSQHYASDQPELGTPSSINNFTPTYRRLEIDKNEKGIAKKFKKLGTRLVLAVIIASLIFSPALALGFFSFTAATNTNKALAALETNNLNQAQSYATVAQSRFTTSRGILQTANRYVPLIPRKTFLKYDQLLDAGDRVAGIINTTVEASLKAETIYLIVTNQSQSDFESNHTTLQAQVESLHTELSLLEASLEKLTFASRLKPIAQLETVKEKLPDLKKRLDLALTILKIMPPLLDTSQPQSYLLVTQDNTQLRPTGGFLTSATILTFQNGQLINSQAYSIPELDSQLDGEVAPPSDLTDQLGETSWFLRDSNWDPNFNNAGSQILWFAEKETGRTLNGVVSLDINALGGLIDSVGGVSLGSTLLTSDNLANTLVYTKPSDLETSQIIETLISRLTTQLPPLSQLVRTLDQSLAESHILVYARSQDIYGAIVTAGWDGAIRSTSCPNLFTPTNCHQGTFSIVETNKLANHANYFLSRSITHDVDLNADGSVNHEVKVSYRNLSSDNSWPAGPYNTYTRFFHPADLVLEEVKIGEQLLEASSSAIPGSELSQVNLNYIVQPNQEMSITLKFKNVENLSTNQPRLAFHLDWQKQPGTSADPLVVNINFPSLYRVDQLGSQAALNSNQITFSQAFSRDLTFNAQLAR